MKAPALTRFGLTESKIAEANLYNQLQDKKCWRATWILLLLIASILSVANAEYFWDFFLSFFLYGLPIWIVYYGLKHSIFQVHDLTKSVEEYKEKVKEYDEWFLKTKVDYWYSLSGLQFEIEVTKLLTKLGYNAIRTKSSGDGGIDIFVQDEDKNYTIIQCKAHKKPVGPHIIRDLYGAMTSINALSAILINLAGFTKGVREFAKGKNIMLWDVSDLIALQNKL